MKFKQLPLAIAVATLTAPTFAVADYDEIDLDESQLYFELNDTDGDLGIHGKADGDAWKRMKIEAPNERTLLNIIVRSRLRRQGLTELFFESAEPTFDELDPEVFFGRFPEGVYEWEGLTLDYLEIEGEVFLSQIIPAAPVVISVGEDGFDENGEVVDNEDNPGFEIELNDEGEEEVVKACWGILPDANGDVVVTWGAVTASHYDTWNFDLADQPLLPDEDLRYGEEDQPERKFPLGVSGELNDVLYYEFVAEIDDTEFKSTAIIPPAPANADNSWTIPAEIIALAPEGEVKFEIIVRVESGEGYDDDGELVESQPGNQSAVEDCFEIVGP